MKTSDPVDYLHEPNGLTVTAIHSTTSPHSRSAHWSIRFEPRPRARLRLVCLPFAGGSAVAYQHWASRLPDWIETIAVQLPGRGPRVLERPYTAIRPLVCALVDNLNSVFDERFAVYGHSMGALLGFELVRELRRRGGRHPDHLIVAAQPAPQRPRSNLKVDAISNREFILQLQDKRDADLLTMNRELRDLVIPGLRADFALCANYDYEEERPMTFPIAALGGSRDRSVSQADLSAWQKQTTGRFELRNIDGDHFFLRDQTGELQGTVVDILSNPVE
jgi:medium-chain acyl-[acyl-carrier-protein] hydrolase